MAEDGNKGFAVMWLFLIVVILVVVTVSRCDKNRPSSQGLDAQKEYERSLQREREEIERNAHPIPVRIVE